MEEYVVVLKKGIDKFQFSREMILPNGEGYIPAREVRITNHRIVSKRLVNYYLTEEEALELLNDERVESISSQKMLNEVKPILHATQKGTFEKSADDDTIDETKMNWGLSRCIHRSDPFNNSSTTDQIEDEYNYTLTGKGVDIIIMDSGVDMNHKEFQNADGTSRVVDYDWRQHYPSYANVADGKRTIHFSGQEPDVNTLTELNEGDIWIDTTSHSDLSSFRTAYDNEYNDGDEIFFDDFYMFDGAEWGHVISSMIPEQTRIAPDWEGSIFFDELFHHMGMDIANNNPTLPHTINVYYQEDQPAGNNMYDFWVDKNDNNKVYKYVGTPLSWTEIVQHSDKNNAFYDFSIALLKYLHLFVPNTTNNDDEVNLWYGPNQPSFDHPEYENYDLWYNGNDLYRRIYSYNAKMTETTIYNSNLHDSLLTVLPYFNISSNSNGKVFTFTHSSVAPTTPSDGDIWFDSTNYDRSAVNTNTGEFGGDLHYWDASTTSWVMINAPIPLFNIIKGLSGDIWNVDYDWQTYKKYDLIGHGTSVASAAAGNTMGFARNATIYPFKVAGAPPGGGITEDMGFELIRKFHRDKPLDPKTGYKRPTVVNMSFGWGQDGKASSEISEIHYRGNTYTAEADGTDGNFTTDDFNNFKIPLRMLKYGYIQSTEEHWPLQSISRKISIEELIDEGIHIIASAGNSNRLIVDDEDEDYNNYVKLKSGSWSGGILDDKLYYNRNGDPYSPKAITVGALSNTYKDVNDQSVEGKSWFSNYGSGIDVYAPGETVLAAFTHDIKIVTGTSHTHPKINNDNNYQVFKNSGTSYAAPIVVGIVACLLEANPGMTPAQVKTWLRNNSTKDIMYDEGKDAVFTDRLHGYQNPGLDNKSVGGGGNRIVYMPFQRAKPLKLTKS